MSKKVKVGVLVKRDKKTVIPGPTSIENTLFKDPGAARGSAKEIKSVEGIKEKPFFPGSCKVTREFLAEYNRRLVEEGKLSVSDFEDPLYGIKECEEEN